MAYDQGYYQPPQRPYNGRAAQPPAPAQGYNDYPPHQQYDQYAQDGYRYDQGYETGGYTQEPYQEPMNGGGRGGNQQWAQNGAYLPPQQDYYGNAGGGQRGGRGPPPNGPPRQGSRDDYGHRGGGAPVGRGYPNGGPPNGGALMDGGRGGRPLDRNPSSDPGAKKPRILDQNQKSPQSAGWDNPFPTFPGAKKKTTMSEEKKIIEKMEHMDLGPDPRRTKTPTGRRSEDQNRRGPMGDGYGNGPRHPRERAPTANSNGRPSIDSQRMPPPRGYPQQPPPQKMGYGGPPDSQRNFESNYRQPQNGAYYDDRGVVSSPTSPSRDDHQNFPRSMTMPNESLANSMTPNGGANYGASAPYNGPAGRVPPRPSTASGTRPPPQRFYPNQDPPQPAYSSPPPVQQSAPVPQYVENYDSGPMPVHSSGHQASGSISSFYDHYLYERDQQPPQKQFRSNSAVDDMPNFDGDPANSQRSQTMDQQTRQPNGSRLKMAGGGSHPDMRAMAQAQSAEVFDMSHEIPQMPEQYQQQGYPQDPYGNGQHDNQIPPNGQRGPPGPQQGYPSRTASGGRSGSAPMNAHPTPVRAGLLPNSSVTPPNNAPVPVRQYGNVAAPAPAPVRPAVAPGGEPASMPVTPEELDRMKEMMKINPHGNLDGQLLLARKLIEASDVLVARLPDQKSRTKAREKYIFDAHKILKKLVAAQHTDAMFFLADCYGRGALGLQPDNKEAFTLYQGAAKAGHAAAAYRTAVCCELGNDEGGGTRKDPLKAIQWYKRAATLGDTPAMYKMGMIQLKGLLGQPKDPREAVGWLKRAAERADAENPHALHELGLLYESAGPNDAIVRDEAYSFSLFSQSANLGYKFSQFRLGCAYEYGLLGLQISPRDSIMWYSRAAVQEEHQSELALSGWYLTGSEGVLQQSDTEAYLWARKAAMAGLAKAEYAMGYFTEVGIGAQSNLDDAKRWYWRAAAQNFPKARERLEDLKKGGNKPALKSRERISRSKVGKQNEGECIVM